MRVEKMGGVRQKKVESLLKEKISNIILQNKLSDPRLEGFIGITDVSVSKDTKYAKIYISCYGPTPSSQIIAILNHASGYIQGLIAKSIKLRFTPKLTFIEDQSLERGFNITQKIKELDT